MDWAGSHSGEAEGPVNPAENALGRIFAPRSIDSSEEAEKSESEHRAPTTLKSDLTFLRQYYDSMAGPLFLKQMGLLCSIWDDLSAFLNDVASASGSSLRDMYLRLSTRAFQRQTQLFGVRSDHGALRGHEPVIAEAETNCAGASCWYRGAKARPVDGIRRIRSGRGSACPP